MGMKPRVSDEVLERAVLYGRLPGVRNADVCERFRITERQLREARERISIYLSRPQLVLSALTWSGKQTSGSLGDLASIAGYVDWQNHDGCTAAEVQSTLDELVADGTLAIDGDRWTLQRPWP